MGNATLGDDSVSLQATPLTPLTLQATHML